MNKRSAIRWNLCTSSFSGGIPLYKHDTWINLVLCRIISGGSLITPTLEAKYVHPYTYINGFAYRRRAEPARK